MSEGEEVFADRCEMRRIHLKIAVVAADLSYQELATKANRHLPPAEHLSEQDITKLVTGRKKPRPGQADAIASVLHRPAVKLFGSRR